jgi:hypothetical protein
MSFPIFSHSIEFEHISQSFQRQGDLSKNTTLVGHQDLDAYCSYAKTSIMQ